MVTASPEFKDGYARRSSRPVTAAVCLTLSVAAAALVAATGKRIGWTWDEVYYFLSSELLVKWAEALWDGIMNGGIGRVLSRENVDAYWLWDLAHNPHPPLYKILSASTWVLFRDALGDFGAYRLSSALLTGVIVLGLFGAVEKKYGLLPAIYGCLALLLMPRFFGHAHIAATEIPVTALWLLCCLAFWRGLSRFSGSLLLGVVFGLALATKFTALLIPGPLVIWCLVYRDRRAVRNLIFMAVLAPAVAVLVNPGWWYDPPEKIVEFVRISLSRKDSLPLATWFLGRLYSFSPPWYYAPVMLAVTVPLTGLLTLLTGAVHLVRQRFRDPYDALLLLPIPFVLGVVMLPATPVHDGVRQFFAILPFLAYLSAAGFYSLLKMIGSARAGRRAKQAAAALLLICLAGLPALEVARWHPFELSYYNQLIGGLRGAYDRGMEVTYWFDAANSEFLEALSEKVPDGSAVSFWPANTGYFEFLQERGLLKRSLKIVDPPAGRAGAADPPEGRPDYLVLMSRLSTFNAFHRNLLTSCQPVYALEHDGVPLISIYRW